MAVTYEPIATTTVSGTTTNVITFSSISGTYTDLIIVVNAKSTSSPGASAIYMRFNNDTASNYSRVRIMGNGSTASTYAVSNITSIVSDGLYNEWGVITFNIMNYANTTTYKTSLWRDNSTSYTVEQVGVWRSTSAITTITLTTDQGYYLAGSTFTLYGIKAA